MTYESIESHGVEIYIFIHQNGSQKKKKNTYIQKYTTNRNGIRNKE